MSTSTARMPKEAIDARIKEGLDTDYELYSYKVIDKNPGQSEYGLAKEMHWSSGRVHRSVRRLEKEGLVHTKRSMQGGRSVQKVFGADWSEFFTEEEIQEFQKLEF